MQDIDDRTAKNWVLGVTSLASFMMALDALVVTTAFATIRADFESDLREQIRAFANADGTLDWSPPLFRVFATL